MHGARYALDQVYVAEVMDPAVFWPIPLAPPCYRGAISFHGAIVAIMDLAAFSGLAPCPELEKIIVLNVKTASLGFLVERVARIIPEREVEMHKAPDVRFASASLCLPEGNAILLDVDAIVREAEISING